LILALPETVRLANAAVELDLELNAGGSRPCYASTFLDGAGRIQLGDRIFTGILAICTHDRPVWLDTAFDESRGRSAIAPDLMDLRDAVQRVWDGDEFAGLKADLRRVSSALAEAR
jgi:hypothetical protein